MSITAPPPASTSESARPALSLCLIARNEEEMLPDCLASISHIVDEIIVVDTGSTDRTREIAQKFGATVLDFEWIDDFAAARNFALQASRGRWILLLDADERLAPEAGPSIRRAIARDEIDCGLLPLHSADALDADPRAVLKGSARLGEPTLLPRLFRRTRDLVWEGLIHEAPRAWLAKPGLKARTLEAPIIHLGDIPEIRTSLKKLDRNLNLLLKRRAQKPGDVTTRVYIAEELYRKQQVEEAKAELNRVWPMLITHWQCHNSGSPTLDEVHLRTFTEKAASLRMLLQVQHNQFKEALQTALRCCDWKVENPSITYLEGVCYEQLALFATQPGHTRTYLANAKSAYTSCLASKGQLRAIPPMEGMTSWRAHQRLGVVLIQIQQPQRARSHFLEVLDTHPDDIYANLGLAEAYLDMSQPHRALEILQGFQSETNPDAHLLMSCAFRDLGRLRHAAIHLDIAYQTVREHLQSPHRLQRLNQLLKQSETWSDVHATQS